MGSHGFDGDDQRDRVRLADPGAVLPDGLRRRRPRAAGDATRRARRRPPLPAQLAARRGRGDRHRDLDHALHRHARLHRGRLPGALQRPADPAEPVRGDPVRRRRRVRRRARPRPAGLAARRRAGHRARRRGDALHRHVRGAHRRRHPLRAVGGRRLRGDLHRRLDRGAVGVAVHPQPARHPRREPGDGRGGQRDALHRDGRRARAGEPGRAAAVRGDGDGLHLPAHRRPRLLPVPDRSLRRALGQRARALPRRRVVRSGRAHSPGGLGPDNAPPAHRGNSPGGLGPDNAPPAHRGNSPGGLGPDNAPPAHRGNSPGGR